MVQVASGPALEEAPLAVRLLRGFAVLRGPAPVELPRAEAKLLAFIALQRRPVAREKVAGVLWGDRAEPRAQACLRSALWRVRKLAGAFVGGGDRLRLADSVSVDLDDCTRRARLILDEPAAAEDGLLGVGNFADELLPDWYDDWVIYERERHRQLSLHALEALALESARRGRYAAAIDAAMAAVGMEPLRESAHRTVIKVHLSEGNRSEALRHYRLYSRLIEADLGAVPSTHLRKLLDETA